MKIIAGILLLFLLILLGIALYIFLTSFTRGKAPVPHDSPARPQMVAAYTAGKQWFLEQPYETVSITAPDGLRLCGYYLSAHSDNTLILMHGYHAEALYECSPMVEYYHNLGYNLLIPHQRAHGESEGKYLSFGILERYDVAAWAEYLVQAHHPKNIFLSGVSMGGATVLFASLIPLPDCVRGIIADCPFGDPAAQFCYSLRQKTPLPPTLFLYLCNTVSHLLAGFRFTDVAVSDLCAAALPLLILHGTNDPTVPDEMSKTIADHYGGPVRRVLFEGCAHAYASVQDPEKYRNAVAAFLEFYRQ
ncbi:MAG: alpha/beta fold hydrolase [Clostridia bacterium]|nr:alpha/beta fold hydrolase [Clostridia bacterium]